MNYELLNKIIDNSGLKKNYIAKELNLTPFGLSKKLIGESEFKASEISKLSNVLKMDTKKRDEIFFE